MKKIILIISLLLSLGAFADDVSFEEGSFYDAVAEMFDAGKKPRMINLLGTLWSGRCFYRDNPNKAENAAYHIKRTKNQIVGPLSHDPRFLYEAAFLSYSAGSANYFDNKDTSDFRMEKDYYKQVFENSSSVIIKYAMGMRKLRVYENYLVEEVSGYSKEEAMAGPLGERFRVKARCYYFIPEYID